MKVNKGALAMLVHGGTENWSPQRWKSRFDDVCPDRPVVLDVRTDPDIPPIPPHATFEQAKDAALALLKGDANRWGVLKEGLLTKAREVLPGQASNQ